MNPSVCLIGAGPGDPELLTLKAVKALGRADVVLVDDLVNPQVLDYCPQARLVYVGKRGGCRSTPQAFIQRLMLRYARQGLRVARLKGGDPCIFGRGGEEAQWLSERGVGVEIINGITAGLAAATACGIPLTHRGLAQGVTLITAHSQDGQTPDWTGLARSGTTLVVYMGVAKVQDMSTQLLAAGMAADTPVAMIERASLADQRECRSTLDCMMRDADAFGLRSPAVLVIGKVAACQVLGAIEEQWPAALPALLPATLPASKPASKPAPLDAFMNVPLHIPPPSSSLTPPAQLRRA